MDSIERIAAVKKALRFNHTEMAAQLGLSRSMYYYVRGGERELGNKAYLELERLEANVRQRETGHHQIMAVQEEANQYRTLTDQERAEERGKFARNLDDITQRAESAEASRDYLLQELHTLHERIGVLLIEAGKARLIKQPPGRMTLAEEAEWRKNKEKINE